MNVFKNDEPMLEDTPKNTALFEATPSAPKPFAVAPIMTPEQSKAWRMTNYPPRSGTMNVENIQRARRGHGY